MSHETTQLGHQYRGQQLTVTELQESGFAHRKTITRLLKQGKLRGYAIGRTYRIDGNSVAEFINANAIDPDTFQPSAAKTYKPDAA